MKSNSNVANSNFGLSVMHFLLRVQHEVKELLIYIRFNIVHCTKTWQIAQTLMRRRILRRLTWVYDTCICKCSCFIFLRKRINHIPTKMCVH